MLLAISFSVATNAATLRFQTDSDSDRPREIIANENSETVALQIELVFDDENIPQNRCTLSGNISFASSDSTADEGVDFTLPDASFSIVFDPVDFNQGGPGSIVQTAIVNILDDEISEDEETAVFSLFVLQNDCVFDFFGTDDGTLRIIDNDEEAEIATAEIDLYLSEDGDIFEESSESVLLGVDLFFNEGTLPQQSCSISGDIVVLTNGSAVEGEDFTIENKSFSIPYSPDVEESLSPSRVEKTTPQSLSVLIIDDDFIDGENTEGGVLEDVFLGITNISNDCGIEIIDTTSLNFNIRDNDGETEPEIAEPIVTPLSEKAGLNKLQASIAEALDNSCTALSILVNNEGGSLNINSNEQSLLSICNQLQSSNTLATDLEALSPKKFSAMRELAVRGGMQQNQNLSKQLARTRQGERGFDISSLSLNVYGQQLSGRYVNEALGAGAGDDIQSDWSAFVGGSVQIGEYEKQDFDLQGNNLYAGLNYQLNSSVIIGAAMGYNQSDASFNSKGNDIEFESYNIALLGSYYVNDDFYLDSVFTYGINDYGTDRRIVIGLDRQQNEGETDGSEMTFAINTGYIFNASNYFFTLFAAFNYVDADIDEFDEEVKGSSPLLGSLLIIEDQDFKSLTSNLGVEFGLTFSTASGVIVPKLSLDWEQQHEDDANIISTQFLADPTNTSWDVTTEVADDQYYNASLSLNAVFKNGFSTYIVYDTELGREDISMYEVSLGARWEF